MTTHCSGRWRFVRAAALAGIASALGGPSRAEEERPSASDLLARIPGLPVIGNPRGNLTMAEFMDYNCGYCRKMQPALARMLEEDGQIRLVVMEWPILSASSIVAAQVALAAAAQGKFEKVHKALFAARGTVDGAALSGVARGAGVDLPRLNKDLSERHDELIGIFRQVNQAAETLGFNATPSLLIGSHPVPGALSFEELKGLVDGVRQLRI